MLLKIDPELDVTKILEFTTFQGALTNTVGKAAGGWQDCDSAKITWFRFTSKSLEWCYGTRNTGDERVDALEVYKTFTPDIRDGSHGTEIPGRLKVETDLIADISCAPQGRRVHGALDLQA